jgi:hypothetical protein
MVAARPPIAVSLAAPIPLLADVDDPIQRAGGDGYGFEV